MKRENRIGQTEGASRPSTEPSGVHFGTDTPFQKTAESTSFGGRQKRYIVHRFAQLRWFDPIARDYVAFADDFSYWTWLKYRFDPGVVWLNAAPKPIAYRRLGTKFASQPLLAWESADGRKGSLWLERAWPVELRQRYEHFSVTHGIDVVLLSRDQLDRDRQLTDNFDFGRQLMAQAVNADVDLTGIGAAIQAHMERHRESTRADLGKLLDCRACTQSVEYLDAALFHLHARGNLRLELKHRPYGDQTRITLT